MPSVTIREIRKPEQGESYQPSQLYVGNQPAFRGMIYTGRARKTEFKNPNDRPSPEAIKSVAETLGFKFWTTAVE
jgi:hypothetical protein